jgi:hypothetical protein
MADDSWRLGGITCADTATLSAELTTQYREYKWVIYCKSKVAKARMIPPEIVNAAQSNQQRIAIKYPSGRQSYVSRTFELFW